MYQTRIMLEAYNTRLMGLDTSCSHSMWNRFSEQSLQVTTILVLPLSLQGSTLVQGNIRSESQHDEAKWSDRWSICTYFAYHRHRSYLGVLAESLENSGVPCLGLSLDSRFSFAAPIISSLLDRAAKRTYAIVLSSLYSREIAAYKSIWWRGS